VNFAPTIAGATTGYLRATYQIQQGTCSFTSGTNPCPSGTANASTLTGTATDPQLVLSYKNSSGGAVVLQPASSTPFDFGNVSTSSSVTVTFLLSNQTANAIPTPVIKLQTTQFFASAFRLDVSSLPASIVGNSFATFTVTFAPGQTGVTDPSTALLVGALTYPLKGTGVIVADIDALQISYTDVTPGPSYGVITRPQAATAIQFDQLVAGGTTNSTFNFVVTNPATSYNPVAVSPLRVSGAGFGMTGTPAAPISIPPGTSITFTLTFAAAASGTYTGSLSIGTRQFTLQGLTVISPFPDVSFQVSPEPLTNQQQATLTIQFASPSSIAGIGIIHLDFTPLDGLTNDPAVAFLATNSRQLSVNLAVGAQTATYNGQSAIAFQTGTTAGKLTFTLDGLPNTPSSSKDFAIPPATIHITSANAVRQSPNLVVTINGYDNTYSAGPLSFTFYDVTGKLIAPVTVNASNSFHQYFLNNTAGGAFALQASFPVQGDVTQVGSVAIGLTNSQGQTNTTQTFQ
jgi:hypothetical protein